VSKSTSGQGASGFPIFHLPPTASQVLGISDN
jgi:hypothetical protein